MNLLLNEDKFPRLWIHRGPKTIKGEYFGPFANGGVIHVLSATDYNTIEESALCENGLNAIELPDNIIIIEGEGGY